MSGKTFPTLTTAECLIAYEQVLNNSNMKWKAGETLAESRDYGSAISMSVISVEELIKSILLLVDGKGFEFRKVKGMDTFFRHHQLRYIIAYIMFVITVFGDDLAFLIKQFKGEPSQTLLKYEKLQKDELLFERVIRMYMRRKCILLRKELDWFSEIDIFRQDGFYCDYKDYLKNPITISKENYAEVVLRLEKVIWLGKGVIESYVNAEIPTQIFIEKHVHDMKENFRKKKVYEKIAETLFNLRQTKENPFSLLKKELISFDEFRTQRT